MDDKADVYHIQDQPGTSADQTPIDLDGELAHFTMLTKLRANLNPTWMKITIEKFRIPQISEDSRKGLPMPRRMQLTPASVPQAYCLALVESCIPYETRGYGHHPNTKISGKETVIVDSSKVSIDDILNDPAWSFSTWQEDLAIYQISKNLLSPMPSPMAPSMILERDIPYIIRTQGRHETDDIMREIYYICLNGEVLRNSNIVLCYISNSRDWFAKLAIYWSTSSTKLSPNGRELLERNMLTLDRKKNRTSFENLILKEYHTYSQIHKDLPGDYSNVNVPHQRGTPRELWVDYSKGRNSVFPLEIKGEEEGSGYVQEPIYALSIMNTAKNSVNMEIKQEVVEDTPETSHEGIGFDIKIEDMEDDNEGVTRHDRTSTTFTYPLDDSLDDHNAKNTDQAIKDIQAEVVKFHEEEQEKLRKCFDAEKKRFLAEGNVGHPLHDHVTLSTNSKRKAAYIISDPKEFYYEYRDDDGYSVVFVDYDRLPPMATANHLPSTPIELFDWCTRGMIGNLSRFYGAPEVGKKDVSVYLCPSDYWTPLMVKNDTLGPWPLNDVHQRSLFHEGKLLKQKRVLPIKDALVFVDQSFQHPSKTVFRHIYWVEKNGSILPNSFIVLAYKTCVTRWKEAVLAKNEETLNMRRRLKIDNRNGIGYEALQDEKRISAHFTRLNACMCAICRESNDYSSLLLIQSAAELEEVLTGWKITTFMEDVREALTIIKVFLRKSFERDGILRICVDPCHLLEKSLGFKLTSAEGCTDRYRCDVCEYSSSGSMDNLRLIREKYELKEYFKEWEKAMKNPQAYKILGPLSNQLNSKINKQPLRVCEVSCHETLLMHRSLNLGQQREQAVVCVKKIDDEKILKNCSFCLKRRPMDDMIVMTDKQSLQYFYDSRMRKKGAKIWVETWNKMHKSVLLGRPIFICRKHYYGEAPRLMFSRKTPSSVLPPPQSSSSTLSQSPLTTPSSANTLSQSPLPTPAIKQEPVNVKTEPLDDDMQPLFSKKPKLEPVEEDSIDPGDNRSVSIINKNSMPRIVINTARNIPVAANTLNRAMGLYRLRNRTATVKPPKVVPQTTATKAVPLPIRVTIKMPACPEGGGPSHPPVVVPQMRTIKLKPLPGTASIPTLRVLPPGGKRIVVMCALCPLARPPEEMLDVKTYEEVRMLQDGLNVPQQKFQSIVDKVISGHRVRVCRVHGNAVTQQLANKKMGIVSHK